jgi:hypothetical protein
VTAKNGTPSSGGSLTGSKDARRIAAAILEVLTGLRTPIEAADALGCSHPRYYQLEARALQGLVDSLEPRPKGRTLTPARQVEQLTKEKERLERELARSQSLLRAAHRSIGLSAPPKKKAKETDGKKRRRKSRPRVRATRAIASLKKDQEPSTTEAAE